MRRATGAGHGSPERFTFWGQGPVARAHGTEVTARPKPGRMLVLYETSAGEPVASMPLEREFWAEVPA